MLDRLLSYMADIPADKIMDLSLEDIALSATWYEENRNSPNTRETAATIARVVDGWLKGINMASAVTEGPRHQLLLRELIDVLNEGRDESLLRDELGFLQNTHDIIHRVKDRALFGRVDELLDPHMEVIHRRRALLEPVPGLPGLSRRLHVVLVQDIESAKPRDVQVFGGIPLPSRGPLFSHAGNLRVIGNIPEHCIVVVEEGNCCIRGFVFGRVASRDDCDVLENIAGVVLAGKGNIRARSIVSNAFVVAKCGSVFCRAASGPRLVFAGTQIRVAEGVSGGSFISRDIDIAGDALGGEYAVTRQLSASRFGSLSRSIPIIAMRRQFSCRDFGGQVGPDFSRLLSAFRLSSQRVRTLAWQIDISEHSMEDSATAALRYLLGGKEIHGKLMELYEMQRREAYLERIIKNLTVLEDVTEEVLTSGSGGSEAAEIPRGDAVQEPTIALGELDLDILQPDEEGHIDPDLAEERKTISDLQKRLGRAVKMRKLTSGMLTEVQEKLTRWVAERDSLRVSIRDLGDHLQRTMKTGDPLLQQEDESSKKSHVLRQLVMASKSGQLSGPMAERMTDPFVALMIRSLGRYLRRANDYREALARARAELEPLCKELWDKYQMRVRGGAEEDAETIKITGCFADGARLCTDTKYLSDPHPPAGNVLQVKPSKDRVRSFVRNPRGISEVSV